MMFNNIGEKCKTVAKILCYTGIAISVIGGLVMIFIAVTSYDRIILALYGVLGAIAGSLVSWLSCIALYGIGEAAENSAIAANLAIKADQERQS